MSRTLKYSVELQIRINESDLKLLRFLDASALGSEARVTCTAQSCAEALGLSVATIRRSYRTLTRRGLVVVRGQGRSDGGRDANSYEVTDLGRRVLAMEPTLCPQRIPAKPRRRG